MCVQLFLTCELVLPERLLSRETGVTTDMILMFIITYVKLNFELKDITLSIYAWFSFNTVFIQNNVVFY